MSGILMDLSPPSADTVVHNSHVLFANQCVMSSNKLVHLFSPQPPLPHPITDDGLE